ncbi:MAG: HAD family hydrolase [Pseudomonadota bacterium]
MPASPEIPDLNAFDLVIFDCDGVLIDSEIISNAVNAEHLTRLGYEISTEEVIRRYTGCPIKEMLAEIEADLGKPLPDYFLPGADAEIERRYLDELKPIDGITAVLDAIRKPKCVASSTYMKKLRWSLELTDLIDRLDPHIFSASQVKRGKPAPDLFLFAAARMGAEPQHCIVIEDSVAGVQAGVSAGMPVIGFTGGGHTYPGHRERLLEAGADCVFNSMKDLATQLNAA